MMFHMCVCIILQCILIFPYDYCIFTIFRHLNDNKIEVIRTGAFDNLYKLHTL